MMTFKTMSEGLQEMVYASVDQLTHGFDGMTEDERNDALNSAARQLADVTAGWVGHELALETCEISGVDDEDENRVALEEIEAAFDEALALPWYACMADSNYDDWGTGTFSETEAREWLAGAEDGACIAVIEGTECQYTIDKEDL